MQARETRAGPRGEGRAASGERRAAKSRETRAEPERRKLRDCHRIFDLAICHATPFATPPYLLLLTAPPFNSRAFPCKQTACLRLSVHCCLVRDIVLQLSVRYCNNRGVINPENPEKKGGGLNESEKESEKGQEASQCYRQGKLIEIVLSSSRTIKKLWCEKRTYVDREYSQGSTKATGFLEDRLETGVPFTDLVCSPCAAKSRHENCTPLGLSYFCC